MSIGENIRNTRKLKGMTQKQLGELAGIAEPTIRRYELGMLNPKRETIQKIANALGVHMLDLMGIGPELDKYTYEVTDVLVPPGTTPSEKEDALKSVKALLSGKDWRDLYNGLSDKDKNEFRRMIDESAEYLKSGAEKKKAKDKPEVTSYSSAALKLANDYDHKLDRWGRQAVRNLVATEIARCEDDARFKEATRLPKEEPKVIPLYLYPAAAGFAAPVAGSDFEPYTLKPDDPPAAEFAVKLQGDSMEPHFPDGSTVFCNRDPMADGDIGIFVVDGETYCKQYHHDRFMGITYLFSLNRERSDADVVLPPSTGRSLVCFGRVMTPQRYPLPNLR